MEVQGFIPTLSAAQFRRICRILYQQCGISLREGKEALVRSRLSRRLRRLGLQNFDQYIEMVESDGSGSELQTLVDSLTTNKTSFFREPQHFAFLQAQLLPQLCRERRPVRFWSAGCSTGEEPYSLAILLLEKIPSIEKADWRILATDISDRVLSEARMGEYAPERLEDVPPAYLRSYFRSAAPAESSRFAVTDSVRALIRFARLNLMKDWPMQGPFDAIFCRNVMIYFDLSTRKELVGRFVRKLRPGGYLFVGHSESLTQASKELIYVQPAIYRTCVRSTRIQRG
jgi:chemotaxis protein methyltransferase CheR